MVVAVLSSQYNIVTDINDNSFEFYFFLIDKKEIEFDKFIYCETVLTSNGFL